MNKQRCQDIVRDVSQKAGLVQTVAVMDYLPEMVNSVTINQKFILTSISEELNKPTANPLNMLLKMFGLRIIRTKDTIQSIRIQKDSETDTSELISVKESLWTKNSETIAQMLGDVEQTANGKIQYLREQNAQLSEKLSTSEQECNQRRVEHNDCMKAVAERAQCIFSQIGQQETSNILFEQANALLDDLGWNAVWYSEKPSNTLFTVLKCSNPAEHKEKPCIMHGEQVISKGMFFQLDEVEEPVAEQK